jgi:N-acetylglucosamine-6-phosphate deacetylase
MRIKGNQCGGGLVEVEVHGDRISSVHPLGPLDPSEPFLSPGFVDIQINGFAGVDFSSSDLTPDLAISVLPALWKTGVTSFCPTLITNTRANLLANFRALEKARELEPRFARSVPCYHLEGPYLSPGPSHGAHDPALMRPPDWNEFAELQAAARGRIGIVTIAPELPGAFEFIRQARATGIIVAISHTDGSTAEVHSAADAGSTLATHLGNGSPQWIDRHRAPFWAQLADDRLSASIICDGFHLPPEIVTIVLRVKGLDRTILVTDAVHVAGLAPGPYTLVGVPIELERGGRVVRIGSNSLAGSSLSMDRAVAIFKESASLSLAEAVSAATLNPATLLGHASICKDLKADQLANLVSFRCALEIEIGEVWLHGERVVPASGFLLPVSGQNSEH